jgi:hypothetical protein
MNRCLGPKKKKREQRWLLSLPIPGRHPAN